MLLISKRVLLAQTRRQEHFEQCLHIYYRRVIWSWFFRFYFPKSEACVCLFSCMSNSKTNECRFITFNLNHLANTLVLTSHESNACSVFVSQACLCTTHVCMGLPTHDQLNAKNTDMEKVLLSLNIITKILVRQRLTLTQLHVCSLSHLKLTPSKMGVPPGI